MELALVLVIAIFSWVVSLFLVGAPTYDHDSSVSNKIWGNAEPISDFPHSKPTNLISKLQTSRLKLAKTKLKIYTPLKPLSNISLWKYGVNSSELRDLLNVWQQWEPSKSPTVQYLARFKQYEMVVRGLSIGYIHHIPACSTKSAVPLLLLHGWPGSIFEYLDVISNLTSCDSGGESYEVIVPSLPGYGFSDAPTLPGFDPVAAAEVLLELMSALAIDKYVVHGGDWGSIIATCMAQIDGGHRVLGLHLTLMWHPYPYSPLLLAAASVLPSSWVFGSTLDAERAFALVAWARGQAAADPGPPPPPPPSALGVLAALWELSGYAHQQSTRPDTLAAALDDSPAALAAWIADKFFLWTDPRAGPRLRDRVPMDWLVANLATYWATGNAGPSLRLYYEAAHSRRFASAAVGRVPVPAAVADFPWELGRMPSLFVRHKFPRLIAHTVQPRGGHFAALEEPGLLAADLRAAVPGLCAAAASGPL